MLSAEGSGTEVTERGGGALANTALMPGAFPSSIWRFAQVEAEEMVSLRTVLFITHDQLSSFTTAVAVKLVGLLAFSLQLALLGLQFSIAHLLLPLHNHCTLGLDSKKTTAVLRATVAGCPPITQTVQVVIKGQFCVSRDITQGEESNPHVSVHRPLLSLAVRTAAVVHKA